MRNGPTSRTIAVALALVLLLAACGNGNGTADESDNGSDSTSGSTVPDTTESSEGDDGDGQTLTVWTYYVSGGQIEALEAQNELFADTHPDVEVEHVQIPFDQLASRLLAGVSTQDGPDVVFDNVVVEFPALAASGALLDMSDYWGAYGDAAQFPESAVWTHEDGGIYNVMSYTNLLAMFYNENVLSEYGIAPPSTIDELETAMATVAAAGQYTPLAMSGVASPEGAWMFMPLLLSHGVNYCNLESDAVEDAFGTMERWASEGYIPTETATWDQADAWQAFVSGDYAFGFNGNWNLGDVDNAPFTVGTALYPAGGSEGSVVFPGGEGIGIGAFTDDPDLAWSYIEEVWMSSEAGQINFQESGQIPTRGDLADTPEVQENELAQPFVEAAKATAAWPGNPNTAAMQNAVGQALSGVISGGLSAADAAAMAIDEVNDEIEAGGGSC